MPIQLGNATYHHRFLLTVYLAAPEGVSHVLIDNIYIPIQHIQNKLRETIYSMADLIFLRQSY